MSKCIFEKQISNASQLLENVKEKILKANGEFTGDIQSGEFSIPSPLGILSGIYHILNEKLTIEIKEKPFLISCALIENEINSYTEQGYVFNLHSADTQKYFLQGVVENHGPLSINELITRQVKKEDQIWDFPRKDWTSAAQIKELEGYFGFSENGDALTEESNKSIPHWGDWKRDGCTKHGYRQYSSIIWGLEDYPKEKWGEMCYAQPITNMAGATFPDRCIEAWGGNVWGEIDVQDSSCGFPPNPNPNPNPISKRYSSCKIWRPRIETRPQMDHRNDIEIEFTVGKNSMGHCPPNDQPDLLSRDLKVIIRNIIPGTWTYMDPMSGAKVSHGLTEVRFPFGTHPTVLFRYRPTNYNPGQYYFSFALEIGGKECNFKDDETYHTIKEGCIYSFGII